MNNENIKAANQNIITTYGNEWMKQSSMTRWVAIQRILAKFKAGKMTDRQIEYWAGMNVKDASGIVSVR